MTAKPKSPQVERPLLDAESRAQAKQWLDNRAVKFPRTRVRGLIDAYGGEEKSASEERNGIACRGAESCQVSAR